MSLRLTLPLPPNRGNARWHWRDEKNRKTSYWNTCTILRMDRDFPTRWPNGTPAKVRIRATLYVWNRMDLDNLTARLKWPLDWLEAWGYIPDDGAGIEWDGLPEQEIDRKRQRVEIILEPAETHDGSEARR